MTRNARLRLAFASRMANGNHVSSREAPFFLRSWGTSRFPHLFHAAHRPTGSPMSRTLLVIGAHSADFVWRAGGVVAVTTAPRRPVCSRSRTASAGVGRAVEGVGQTVERVKEIRHGRRRGRARRRVRVPRSRRLPPGDRRGRPRRDRRPHSRARARCADHAHGPRPVQPDHAAAFFAVEKARALAAGAGVPSAFETVEPPELLLFEPHQPELCNFVPTTFVDITPVIEQKRAAMAEMKAPGVPAHVLRAAGGAAREPRAPLVGQLGHTVRRGVPARDAAGRRVVTDTFAELARLGTATVHEAAAHRSSTCP